MKPEDFYNRLSSLTQLTNPVDLTFYNDDGTPSKLTFKTGPNDAWAAKVILYLQYNMPEDTTVGDLLDVLANATWWATFWSSLKRDDEDEQPTSRDHFYTLATQALHEDKISQRQLGKLIHQTHRTARTNDDYATGIAQLQQLLGIQPDLDHTVQESVAQNDFFLLASPATADGRITRSDVNDIMQDFTRSPDGTWTAALAELKKTLGIPEE